MSAPADLDLASIPERIQSEAQRAIQRSIKGVEYIASSGPALGSTPKDILYGRGTMNLYHYRPIADELSTLLKGWKLMPCACVPTVTPPAA